LSRALPRLIAGLVLPLFLTVAPLAPFHLFAQARSSAPPSLDSAENGFSVSPTLFATLAAINAAGYDAGIDSPLNEHYKVRTQIRNELASRNIPSLAELRAFYKEHKKPNETADLSQYISFAMFVKGPPDFDVPAGFTPPDVGALEGFNKLLARFYKEANLEDLWNRSQPAYAAAVGEYQDAVINALFEANGYLRNPSGYQGRRFQIFLDLLAAPDQIQIRNFQNDCFVVISPTTAPVVNEIRDAYLSYLLDPLTFKYKETIKGKKALAKYAEGAPALDLAYKDDFSLMLTKSLIRALEVRLSHSSPDKREQAINQAVREGFVLTASFAELLPAYEKQQESFRIYYPELISAIDVRKEEKRLKNVQFAQSLPPRVIAPPSKMQVDPADESLMAADGSLDQKDYETAKKLYRRVLEQTADKAKQGQALYGLAVIDLGEKRWPEAINLFQRTVEANPSPATTAWAHYYLGRLALRAGETDRAKTELNLVLTTEGATSKARDAAQQALQSMSGEQK
jgi:tetratricopeptide (TPR) repeat protein